MMKQFTGRGSQDMTIIISQSFINYPLDMPVIQKGTF